MTQRRIFAFLWPDPPPVPVDERARQDRYLRVSGRGPVRLVLLVALSLLTFGVGLVGAVAVSARPTAVALVVVAAALAVLVPVLARCWQVGTYVSDHGIRIITLPRTIRVPWSDVTSLESDGSRVHLSTQTHSVATHIASSGLDFIGRREAYDIARDRLTNWWQQR